MIDAQVYDDGVRQPHPHQTVTLLPVTGGGAVTVHADPPVRLASSKRMQILVDPQDHSAGEFPGHPYSPMSHAVGFTIAAVIVDLLLLLAVRSYRRWRRRQPTRAGPQSR